jgi:hypothetical protein
MNLLLDALSNRTTTLTKAFLSANIFYVVMGEREIISSSKRQYKAKSIDINQYNSLLKIKMTTYFKFH